MDRLASLLCFRYALLIAVASLFYVPPATTAENQNPQSPLTVPGPLDFVQKIELVSWAPENIDWKIRVECDVSNDSITCTGGVSQGASQLEIRQIGKISGSKIEFRDHLRFITTHGPCTSGWEGESTSTHILSADGNETFSSRGGPAVSWPCNASQGASQPFQLRPANGIGTWRVLAGAGLCSDTLRSQYLADLVKQPSQRRQAPGTTVALTEGGQACMVQIPAASQQVVLTTPDGKQITINLSEWNGGTLSVQQMALVKQFKLAPPPGSDAAKASGGAGYTLNAYNYLRATGPNVPVFVGMPRLDEGAQAAASAALEGAQATASWVKANPGKASLAALGLAVAIAMPYTVAFQASAVGMTFFESAGIGFMTAATPAAVSSLATSAISGEGFWTMSGKAALSGTISGAESLVSTVVGTGVTGMVTGGAALTQKLVGSQFSEAAVTGFGAVTSGVASTATDLGVGVLHDQVAANIANSASTTNIPDIVTPSRPAPTGGIMLPFLSRPLTQNIPK